MKVQKRFLYKLMLEKYPFKPRNFMAEIKRFLFEKSKKNLNLLINSV